MWILIAASQLAAPQAVGLKSWFSDDDYPSSQSSSRETAFRTVTQTLVDARGKIVGCRTETPSSDPQIDARACAIILKRGKFESARWSDGARVPGVYRTSISFILY